MQQAIRAVGRLAVSGLACLYAFYMAMSIKTGVIQEGNPVLAIRSATLDLLSLTFVFCILCCFVAPLLKARLRALSYFLVALGLALLLTLLLTEFSFHDKTGSFFGFHLALYALKNWSEMHKVLSSGVDRSSLIGLLLLAISLAIFATGQASRKAQWLLRRGLALTLLTLIAYLALEWNPEEDHSSSFAQNAVAFFFADGTGAEKTVAPDPYDYTLQHLNATQGRRPNIIIFISESTRAASIPDFPGSQQKAVMPHVQWLQSHGAAYDRAYTTTSHTSKALIGILCGIQPSPVLDVVETRVQGLPVRCLPNLLHDFGYQSLFIQSATREFENRSNAASNFGFDQFLSKEDIAEGFQSSGYFGTDERAMLKPFKNWWSSTENATKPRLGVFLTSMTHHPYQMLGQPVGIGQAAKEQSYLQNLAYVDQVLGQIINFIQARGELDNTIVVFTGDHGEGFTEHDVLQHDGVPFEEGIRVPLVVFDGRLPIGKPRDDALRQHIDLLPTLLHRAGLSTEGNLPGVDLADAYGHQRLFTNCWGTDCQTLIEKDRKWIYYPLGRHLQVFDLKNDPAEVHNQVSLYTISERKAAVASIQGRLASIAQFFNRNAPPLQARTEPPEPR